MEKIIFTILENGSYGSRPMTTDEMEEHETLIKNAVPVADRVDSE
jgi:hypothetical protein